MLCSNLNPWLQDKVYCCFCRVVPSGKLKVDEFNTMGGLNGIMESKIAGRDTTIFGFNFVRYITLVYVRK
jgi:hypothetical protein